MLSSDNESIMHLQFSPFLILLAIAILVSLSLAILVWRQRKTPGASVFFILMLGLVVWLVAAIAELSVVDLQSKILFSKTTYIGIVTVLTAWLIVVLQQTGHEHWLKRRTLALLMIEPIAVVVLVWTNEYHHLIWTDTKLMLSGNLTVGDFAHGIGFWIHAVYSYVIMLLTTFLLVRRIFRYENLYRRQAVVMLLSVFAPLLGNAIFLMGYADVDLTPFGFTITSVFVAIGLLRLRLLDIVPVARETVIESMPDGLLVLDAQNRILDLNKAAMKLIGGGQQWAGSTIDQLLPELEALLKDDTNDKQELMLTRENSVRYLEVQISSVTDNSKYVRGRAVLLHDITRRKQAAQRIEEQNAALEQAIAELEVARAQAEEATRLKSQFLATMSHELRTPLTAIIGYTEIQLAGMTGPLNAEQVSFQDRVLVNAEHLLKLINEILDLAKIEAGRTEVVKKPFVVNDWVVEVVGQMSGLAAKKELAFEHTFDEQLPAKLLGDAPRLKQVVINLLSNAIKFTEHGKVNLDLRRHDDATWTVTVSDTGIGIPAHMQEIVFEEFRQVDSSSTRIHGGTGLGLAIVRKLVLLMGGNIRLSSQVGQGSTFVVTLPLMEAQKESEHAEMSV
jgi:PAS domain S-box-containing protein